VQIVPWKFAADHLQRRPPEVLLFRPSGEEKWRVRYYHSSSTRGFNCQRWVKFVWDNGLREGDVCVFELIKGAKRKNKVVAVAMAVHMIISPGGGRRTAGLLQWANFEAPAHPFSYILVSNMCMDVPLETGPLVVFPFLICHLACH
jgi:hypothetical protein